MSTSPVPPPSPSRWPGRISLLVIGGLIFAGGWKLGRQTGNAKPATSAHAVAKIKTSTQGTTAPHNVAWDPHSSLADILKKYKGGDRIAALVQLVENTPVEQLAHLMDEAASCPQTDIRQPLGID